MVGGCGVSADEQPLHFGTKRDIAIGIADRLDCLPVGYDDILLAVRSLSVAVAAGVRLGSIVIIEAAGRNEIAWDGKALDIVYGKVELVLRLCQAVAGQRNGTDEQEGYGCE